MRLVIASSTKPDVIDWATVAPVPSVRQNAKHSTGLLHAIDLGILGGKVVQWLRWGAITFADSK